MPYLKARVQDFGLPKFVNRLLPITEFSFKIETSNFDGNERTTGTINPGLLYLADKYQLGVEAIIPINRASGMVSVFIPNLHLFLEDIYSQDDTKAAFCVGLRSASRALNGLLVLAVMLVFVAHFHFLH
jgi:hypothetical protein